MQVVTLDELALDIHAARLAKLVEENSSDFFDAVVAVRRGGSFVCDAFCRHFPRHRYGNRYDVTLQRPSTKRKNRIIGKILKRLPLPLLNLLRMTEARILSLSTNKKISLSTPTVELPAGLTQILKEPTGHKILLIDDAIDSGNTLYAIANTLKNTNRDINLTIAVITVTTNHPRVTADYSLYQNRTLIRFPWSNDYKNQ